MDKLSVVIPCYNEEKSIPLFYQEIYKVSKEMKDIEFEFIFIDDGSNDNTLNEIKSLRENDRRCKYISFSRNFGKEAALYAGLNKLSGEYIAMMDVDLQDPPKLLKEMLYLIKEEGYDTVAARRVTRKGEPVIRSFFARQFYKLINKVSKNNIVDGARDFRIMTRQVAEAVLKINEYNRFSKGIFSWVGFSTKWIEYENENRIAGESKWSFWKLAIYAVDGILAFSTVPLNIAAVIGILFFSISIIMISIIIVKTLIYGDPTTGWPSLACIIFFSGGIQLFCTGILGQYLAKTYLEAKRRPIYIVKEEE